MNNNTLQTELFPNQNHIKQSISEAREKVLNVLANRGWMTAKQLTQACNLTDRELRLVVEYDTDGDILSYPGSPGYKLFSQATIEEIKRVESLRSQAVQMIKRYMRYQRKRHQ